VLVTAMFRFSTQCLRNLLEEGVRAEFFTRNGIYKGTSAARLRKVASCACAMGRCRDQASALAFGKAVVGGKILASKQLSAAYSQTSLAGNAREGIVF